MGRLGDFIFKASGVSFSNLSRSNKYHYTVHKIVEGYPILVGNKDIEKITLKGELFTEFHKLTKNTLEDLREMASSLKPYQLSFTDITRTKRQGHYVITNIKEESSILQSDGVPLKTTFILELLKKYED